MNRVKLVRKIVNHSLTTRDNCYEDYSAYKEFLRECKIEECQSRFDIKMLMNRRDFDPDNFYILRHFSFQLLLRSNLQMKHMMEQIVLEAREDLVLYLVTLLILYDDVMMLNKLYISIKARNDKKILEKAEGVFKETINGVRVLISHRRANPIAELNVGSIMLSRLEINKRKHTYIKPITKPLIDE